MVPIYQATGKAAACEWAPKQDTLEAFQQATRLLPY